MMDDIDRIMWVMDAAFDPKWGEAWSRRQIEDALQFPHTYYQLIGINGDFEVNDGTVAGFTLSRRITDEEELLLIAVDPAYRKRGIGAALISRLVTNAQSAGVGRVFLEMRDNNPAESLYLASGFEPIGRRTNYYKLTDGDCVDAITLALDVQKCLNPNK
ncbi:GNAT family N-acetyltransferase [Altererythrobacter sp. ZODW24]|uniref:GNAT family N-acetyltransferase n=1 Tax=Altererythrobacter sp. ZODW24 TaxID=2185142 RepID=UPI000DF7B507|nr:GNAT family N-acetyltransferase [Altererythrobacter sp. ZODW24]